MNSFLFDQSEFFALKQPKCFPKTVLNPIGRADTNEKAKISCKTVAHVEYRKLYSHTALCHSCQGRCNPRNISRLHNQNHHRHAHCEALLSKRVSYPGTEILRSYKRRVCGVSQVQSSPTLAETSGLCTVPNSAISEKVKRRRTTAVTT